MSFRVFTLFLFLASTLVAQESVHSRQQRDRDVAGGGRQGMRMIFLPGSHSQLRINDVTGAASYSRDSGRTWERLQDVSGDLRFHYSTFDPIQQGEPDVPDQLQAPFRSNLRIVQFETQILTELREGIIAAGAEILRYLPDQAYLVRMDPSAVAAVEALPYVRWVGAYHSAYRLEREILDVINRSVDSMPSGGEAAVDAKPYNIMMVDPARDRQGLIERLEEFGITVQHPNGIGILMVVEMIDRVVPLVASDDAVLWIDRLTPVGEDIDLARIQGGANYLEAVAGVDGKGMSGFVMEGAWRGHAEFTARPPFRDIPYHIGDPSFSEHGHNTAGEIYAEGVRPDAKGLMPFAQMGYCNANFVSGNDNRIMVTGEAIAEHKVMVETASWGYARTTLYTSRSAEMDNIVFNLDLLVTNSQSNAGGTAEPRGSRPQAWAKNVLSIGAFRHFETVDPSDDVWLAPGLSGGSIGPAEDGRIKPELSAYYDSILTTSAVNYNLGFGGTSGATPIVNGYAGLTTQMFALGMFGHPGAVLAADRNPDIGAWEFLFDFRPHFTTTKALMINTARQHIFSGEMHDMTRVHQGWGMPSVQDLYDQRGQLFVVNEDHVLAELEARTYQVFVPPGTPEFRATMVYADQEAVPGSVVDRINSLDLRVLSPGNVEYHGNNGLSANMYSTPGGSANDLDTVENVWIQNPVPGIWQVIVQAAALRLDGHTETAGIDADYALVVNGVAGHNNMSRVTVDLHTWPELGANPGSMTVQVENLPQNWAEGFTFFSSDVQHVRGIGNYHGLEEDATFNAILAQPLLEGSVFHFTNGATNVYPYVEFQCPQNVANLLQGMTFDVQTVFMDANGQVIDISNVDRATIR